MSPDERPIRAVVFDLDGLMFDTEAVFFRAASAMLRDRGKTFTPAIMRAMIGRQPAESGRALQQLSGLDDPPDDLMAEAKRRFELLLDADVQPMPGLLTLLDFLRDRQIPIAVGTSSGRAYADRLLRGHGVVDRFAFVLGREDVARHKPDPEIYRTAAQRLGFPPAEVLVLEDTPTGIQAARSAGTLAVGIPHDYSPASDLGAADQIVESLDDPRLLAMIDRGQRPRTA